MKKCMLNIVAMAAIAGSCSVSLAEDPVRVGDIVFGLSSNAGTTAAPNGRTTLRQSRGGLQFRLPTQRTYTSATAFTDDLDSFGRAIVAGPGQFGNPADPAAPTTFPTVSNTIQQNGAWTGQAFIQSLEFDNASGLRKNARGNLLGLNFGTSGTAVTNGGQLFNISTNGSNTISPALFQFNSANTGEGTGQRASSIGVSPNNTKICGSFFDSGKVFVMNYNAGSTVGTGSGASVSTYASSASLNSVSHTFGVKWLNDTTLVAVYTNISITTVATLSVDPVTNAIGAPVVRAQFAPFLNSGNSRFYDIAYEPSVSPFVYVLYSLRSSVTENRITVLNPAAVGSQPNSWAEVATFDVSTSIGTTREVALGADRRLYLGQFSNDALNPGYIDAINLDRDNNGTITAFEIQSLGNNLSENAVTRVQLPVTALDLGSSFAGLDVAMSAPNGTPVTGPVGACCLPGTAVGCLAQVTSAACVSYGGTYQGNNSTCQGCAPVTGACCNFATGACQLLTFDACVALASTDNYFGDGSVCAPNACDGPGACCINATTCTILRTTACYEANGYFRGIGSVCAAVTCVTPNPVLATFDFDSTNPLPDGNNLSYTVTPDLSNSLTPGTFQNAGGQPYAGSTFDVFGVINRATNTDFADDTAGVFPQDSFGIVSSGKTDNFFGVEDLLNTPTGTGTGSGSASWTFNVAGRSALQVQIDMASLGNFEDAAQDATTPDTFNFSYQIDNGPAQPLFSSSVLVGQLTYSSLEQPGSQVSYIGGTQFLDPLAINGIQLRNQFIRFLAPVVGSGSTLRINFSTTQSAGGEIFAFDNITIRGSTGPVLGLCCAGAICRQGISQADCVALQTTAVWTANGAGTCPGTNLSPCCKANYNHTGARDVNDIFAFLADWFARRPASDILGNGTGAGGNVNNIFAFLAAWFAAGCT